VPRLTGGQQSALLLEGLDATREMLSKMHLDIEGF
jgi:hypothetical protein